ncbi:MAG: tetratricopeptide repeat protein, partial [Bacteroidetes bacterium]|nr:tetratricopeptide repeat protein [Bacteroidota bacterium]
IWIRGEVFPEELVNQIAILLGSIPSCQEDLEKIIKEEKIGVKKLHKVLKLAKENQIKILLLWDQAEEILNGDQKIKEDVNPSFIQILCQGTDLNLKVVFASRQKVKGIDISFIHLQNLSKPEVFRLINLGRKNSEHISLKEAEFLYEELGGHPHSLMLLIAFLKEQPSLDWNLLKNEIISIKSTVSAQDLLFPKIWDSLSYNEKQVLLICSLFDKPVWLFILVDIFPNLDVNILSILEILQEKSLGEFLKIRSTSNHPFDLLNENSLAKRAGDPAFFLHPLIRDFIFQNYLENGEKQAFHRIIAQVFTSWALKAKPYGTAVVSESNNTQIFKKFTRLEQDIKFMLEEEAVNHQLLGEDFVSYQNSVLKLSRALWEEMYLERAISILRQALEYPEIKVIASQVGYMLGIMYMDLEKYDLSEKYLKEALEEAHEKEDLISMSDAHSELALLYREQRDYERSTFHFQEYLKISHWLESEGYVTDLKKHLQGRARILTNYVAVLQETGKSQEAVNMIESAIAIYEYYGSTAKLYVHAQTTLATLFFSLEEWGKAEDAYYKALNRSEQIGLQNVEKILFGLGRIEERKANHVGALEFYEKALNGLKSKNLEQSDTANVIRRRIYGLLKLKGNGREVQRMQKALKAYESRYEDPFELLDKATILFEEGEYSEVEKILESVNTLIKGNLQPVILGNCQFQYGRLYRAVGQLGKSEIYFREALSTIQNLSFDDSSLLGIIWGEMGKLLMELNRFHEAKKSFEEALSFFSRLGMIGHEVQVLNDLSMVAYELDEFEGMV